jgi:AcrR family transcriptional regulator
MTVVASAPQRRVGSERSKTRPRLLEAAEAIMLHDGYAAVTFRSVASRAGVASGLVQYYFPSLDDLFVALLRLRTEQQLEYLATVGELEQPLRAMWAYSSDARGATLLMEFMAASNNRKAIRTAMGEGGERIRQAQLAVLEAKWADYGLDEREIPPAGLLFAMSALPRMILLEEAFGTRTGHAEITEVVERFLDRVEPRKVPRRKRTAG